MRNLNVTMEQQCQSEWCWAAVALSVAKFYCPTISIKQCDIANYVLGHHNCCPENPACNIPRGLREALNFKGNYVDMLGPVKFDQLTAEIDQDRPIAAMVSLNQNGHFLVIDGYEETQVGNIISIRDPLFQSSVYVFEAFQIRYTNGLIWRHTYPTQKGNLNCQ
ncbi:hypothetical protein CCAX7_36590 [Capsulimonas corticalis]|uniref:Peptidase C39-like domain-containing protein n=1 Tax=Capsulimonas corticalis TaxID=2219043 RepID=A0A402D1B1_9BACT|nr:hypothetical protein CCAX7_36590 [Capsulimonas corticalis]